MEDRELLETILKSMVSSPDEVAVTRSTDEGGVLLTVKLGSEDVGSIIGKAGGTITIIRDLMRIVGAIHKSRINIHLDVPDKKGGGGGPRREQEDRGHYPMREKLEEAIGSDV